MPDATLGAVDVVVEEDVALPHLLDREVAGDRVHQRGVRPAGELAQQPVVDAGAEVVGVADHRAAAGAADRGLDLHLDRGQGALDDLDQHRVGTGAGVGGQVAERELRRCPAALAHASLLVTMMLRYSSMRAVKPGCSGTVEPNSSMIAGPVTTVPGARSARQSTGVSTYPSAASKQTCRSRWFEQARWRLSRTTGGRLVPLDLRAPDRADAGDPEVDPLDLLGGVAGEVVAVERAVLGVERVGDRVEHAGVDRPSGTGDPDLEGLAEVAQVGGADELVLVVGEALLGQRRRGLAR